MADTIGSRGNVSECVEIFMLSLTKNTEGISNKFKQSYATEGKSGRKNGQVDRYSFKLPVSLSSKLFQLEIRKQNQIVRKRQTKKL